VAALSLSGCASQAAWGEVSAVQGESSFLSVDVTATAREQLETLARQVRLVQGRVVRAHQRSELEGGLSLLPSAEQRVRQRQLDSLQGEVRRVDEALNRLGGELRVDPEQGALVLARLDVLRERLHGFSQQLPDESVLPACLSAAFP